MATITKVVPSRQGFGVDVSWAFDCGHTDVLFYGGEEFARIDGYVAAKTQCLMCDNHRILEERKAAQDV